ncbi:MAG: universal stress protein [Desulfobacteraceae bacterium]|nr:universal stress protein [Desulfobacteraceae bacterium]
MIQKTKKILFASDLTVDMIQVFEHAATLSAYHDADIVVLHVMMENSGAENHVKMAFGEELYKDLKSQQKKRAQNALTSKNVDALKIRQAIAGFFGGEADTESNELLEESPIKKILIAEGRSIADEIAATVRDEGCDLIVMGYKNKGVIGKAIGNNLVGKVIKRSDVPIFVIPFSKE